jgi:hypothetical protein
MKVNLVLSPLKQNKDLPIENQNSDDYKQLIIQMRQKKNRNSTVRSSLVKSSVQEPLPVPKALAKDD